MYKMRVAVMVLASEWNAAQNATRLRQVRWNLGTAGGLRKTRGLAPEEMKEKLTK